MPASAAGVWTEERDNEQAQVADSENQEVASGTDADAEQGVLHAGNVSLDGASGAVSVDDSVDAQSQSNDVELFSVENDDSFFSLSFKGNVNLKTGSGTFSYPFPSLSNGRIQNGGYGSSDLLYSTSSYLGQQNVTYSASSGSYLDYSIPYTLSRDGNYSLLYGGNISISFYYSYRSASTSGGYNSPIQQYGYPLNVFSSAQLLVNDTPVGDIVYPSLVDKYQVFDFSAVSIPLDGLVVSSLGVRFNFSSLSHSTSNWTYRSGNYGVATSELYYYVRIDDGLTVSLTEPDFLSKIVDFLSDILDAIKSGDSGDGFQAVVNAINSLQTDTNSGFSSVGSSVDKVNNTLTSTDTQNQASAAFREELEGQLTFIDETNEKLEAVASQQPTAEQINDIRPSQADIGNIIGVDVTDTSFTDIKGQFRDFLSDKLIMYMLTVVATYSLMTYALHGKGARSA